MHKIVDGKQVPLTAEEIAALEAAAEEWEAARPVREAEKIRKERDFLLAECDWVVIKNTEKGTNIPAEWEIYRQALRDITSQEGFPDTVSWPVKPQ